MSVYQSGQQNGAMSNLNTLLAIYQMMQKSGKGNAVDDAGNAVDSNGNNITNTGIGTGALGSVGNFLTNLTSGPSQSTKRNVTTMNSGPLGAAGGLIQAIMAYLGYGK